MLLPSPTPPVPVFFLRLDAPHFVFSAVRVPALVFRGQGTSGWSGAPVVSPAIGVVGMIIQAGNNEIHVVPACILKHVSNAACFDTSIGTLSVPYASLRELAAKQVHNDGCIDWYGLRAPAVFAIWNLVGKCVKAVVMRGEVAKRELLQVGVTHGKMGGRWDGVAVVCRGFVFVRLSLQYLQSFGREWRWEAPTQLVERMGGREGEEEEVVVIARGKGCLHRVVVVVRGEKVRGLKDLVGGGVFELDDGRKLHMKGGEMRKYNKE